MKRGLYLLLALIIVAVSLGCSTSIAKPAEKAETVEPAGAVADAKTEQAPTEKTAPTGEDKIVFANLTLDLSDEFHANVDRTFRTLFEGTNVELVTSDCGQDMQLQQQQLESYIAMGVDYIYIATMDFDAMRQGLLDARAQGIKVIVYGSDPGDPELYDVLTVADEYSNGDACARAAAKWVDETFPDAPDGSIETVVFDVSALSSMEVYGRIVGLMNVDKYSSKIKVVDKPDPGLDITPTKFQELIDANMIAHPETKVIVTWSAALATSVNESLMMMPELDKEHIWVGTTDWNSLLDGMLAETQQGNSVFRCAIGFDNPAYIVSDVVLGRTTVPEDKVLRLNSFEVTTENLADYSGKY